MQPVFEAQDIPGHNWTPAECPSVSERSYAFGITLIPYFLSTSQKPLMSHVAQREYTQQTCGCWKNLALMWYTGSEVVNRWDLWAELVSHQSEVAQHVVSLPHMSTLSLMQFSWRQNQRWGYKSSHRCSQKHDIQGNPCQPDPIKRSYKRNKRDILPDLLSSQLEPVIPVWTGRCQVWNIIQIFYITALKPENLSLVPGSCMTKCSF